MSSARSLFLLLLLAASVCLIAKDKGSDQEKPQGWLPITQQDLAIKEVPHDPGADAIQLYMSYYKDDDAKFISVYKRIKILRAPKDPTKDRANVEIPIGLRNRSKSCLPGPFIRIRRSLISPARHLKRY